MTEQPLEEPLHLGLKNRRVQLIALRQHSE